MRAPARPSGRSSRPKSTVAAKTRAGFRNPNRPTGGPGRTRARKTTARPISARISPSIVGKYAGPMRIAVPIGWSRPRATAAHPSARKMIPDRKSFERPKAFQSAISYQPRS